MLPAGEILPRRRSQTNPVKQREKKEGVLNMQKSLFPGYTIGPDAYEDIVNVCPAYGKR